MKIGDVSTQLGMPASTIRYYEKIGLIDRQRRVSGQRVFDNRSVFSLEFVRLSQAAGFTIAETKSLLDEYNANPEITKSWKEQAQRKRDSIRTQMNTLKQMDHILSELISCKCPSLSKCVQKGMALYARH